MGNVCCADPSSSYPEQIRQGLDAAREHRHAQADLLSEAMKAFFQNQRIWMADDVRCDTAVECVLECVERLAEER